LSAANRKDTAVGSLEARVEQLESDMQFMKVHVYFSWKRLHQAIWGLLIGNLGLLLALVWTWWG